MTSWRNWHFYDPKSWSTDFLIVVDENSRWKWYLATVRPRTTTYRRLSVCTNYYYYFFLFSGQTNWTGKIRNLRARWAAQKPFSFLHVVDRFTHCVILFQFTNYLFKKKKTIFFIVFVNKIFILYKLIYIYDVPILYIFIYTFIQYFMYRHNIICMHFLYCNIKKVLVFSYVLENLINSK